MREIKFRVWNGTAMEHSVLVGQFGVFYVNPSNNGLDEKDSASITPYNTKYHDDIPVMQFTGLKDCNGVEIYEGDICTIEYDEFALTPSFEIRKFTGVVKFIDGSFMVCADICGDFAFQEMADVKVIGNAHQNPELLEL